MKRKMKIVQISGLRGLFTFIGLTACLAAGFIAFPGYVAMHIWNFGANFVPVPEINFYQGILLWAIIAISGYIINDKKKFIAAYSTDKSQLSEEEVRKLMERVKFHSQAKVLNSMNAKSDKIKSQEETVEESKEKENV